MRIVHFCPKKRYAGLLAGYLHRISEISSDTDEVEIVYSMKGLREKIVLMKPDIVNIHTCWNKQCHKALRLATSYNCATVLSPHWDLDPYSRHSEQYISKSLKLLAYQYRVVHRVETILTTTDAERKNIEHFRWNRNIGTVKSSLLAAGVSSARESAALKAFYTKAVKSRYYKLITADEITAFFALLREGYAPEESKLRLTADEYALLRGLDASQWERILLLAYDEDVLRVVKKTALRAQLNPPAIVVEDIDRFPLPMEKSKGSLSADKFLEKKSQRDATLGYLLHSDETVLRSLAVMIANARALIGKRQMSIRQLCELYARIKYDDYDEDRLSEILKTLHLRTFAASLLGIMVSWLHLEEGFLPFEPRAGRQAQRMKRQLLLT